MIIFIYLYIFLYIFVSLCIRKEYISKGREKISNVMLVQFNSMWSMYIVAISSIELNDNISSIVIYTYMHTKPQYVETVCMCVQYWLEPVCSLYCHCNSNSFLSSIEILLNEVRLLHFAF